MITFQFATRYPTDVDKRPVDVVILNNICEQTKAGDHSGITLKKKQKLYKVPASFPSPFFVTDSGEKSQKKNLNFDL